MRSTTSLVAVLALLGNAVCMEDKFVDVDSYSG
jgi:hypothetical protein